MAHILKTKGKIKSGFGDFSYRMQSVPGLLDAYERKTAMRFFPGSLNIKLEQEFSFPKTCLRLEGHEYGGRVSSNILPSTLNGINCFVIRTDKNEAGLGSHPKDIIEVACDIKLRDKLNLQDGDEVEIVIFQQGEV